MCWTELQLKDEEERGEKGAVDYTKKSEKECKTCFALWKSERRREYQT